MNVTPQISLEARGWERFFRSLPDGLTSKEAPTKTSGRKKKRAIRSTPETRFDLINSLGLTVALLNSKGVIRAMSEAWRLASKDTRRSALYGAAEGANFIEFCCAGLASSSRGASDVMDGLRSAIKKREHPWSFEDCYRRGEQETWYRLSIVPLAGRRKDTLVRYEDVSEKVIACQTSDQAEKKIRLLAQTVASEVDAIFLMDLRGILFYVNDGFRRTYDYTEEEILNERFSLIFSSVVPDHVVSEILRDSLAGTWHGEVLNRRRDGSEVPVELWTSLLKNDDQEPVAIVGVARDISKRQTAEKALRESNKRFRSLIENTSDVVCVLRSDGVIAYVSPSVERILGFVPDELIGTTGLDLLHPDDYMMARDIIADALAHPGITGPFVDIRCRQKLGSWILMQGIGKAIVDDSGERSVVLSLRDLTERRRTEQVQAAVYRISEAAHIARDQAQLFSSVHSIIAELMTARNFYIALYNKDEDLLEFPYHQDEFDTVWSPMRPGKSLTGYVLRTGKPLLVTQAVFNRLVASGEVELVGTPSSDWLGVPLKRQNDEVFGVMVVQTYGDAICLGEDDKNVLMFVSTQIAMAIERTRAMTELKESEERYRHLFYRSPVAIFHYDTDLRVTVFNDQFVALLQSSSDRLQGLDMHKLQDRRVLPAICEALAGREGSYEGGYNAMTSRAQILVSMKTAPLFGEGGKVTGGVGIIEDITERKRTEERILSSLNEKEVLLKEVHHRVKNNMQVISSLLSLQANESTDPKIREGFVESQNRVRSMALVHEKLYRSGDLARIEFGEYLRSVTAQLARISTSPGVKCSVVAEKVLLGIDIAIPCGLIVNELVTNSLKHAFVGGGKGTVTVRLRRPDEGHVELTVQDDGIGFPADRDFRRISSMGFTLINSLAKQLSSSISLDREGGTKFVITFPG